MPKRQAERTVLFVEVRAFPIACHRLRDHALVRRPLGVCGDRDGTMQLLSVSSEALRCGLRPGWAADEALQLCPQVVLVPAEPELYRVVHEQLLLALRGVADSVQPLRLGAAWAEATGRSAMLGRGLAAAGVVLGRLSLEVGLPVAVGVGPNRLLAQAAAREIPGRPAGGSGARALSRADVPSRLWPLPATELPAVGPALSRRLSDWGIATVGDIASRGPGWWERQLGATGARLWGAAHGRDDTPVGGRPPLGAWVTACPPAPRRVRHPVGDDKHRPPSVGRRTACSAMAQGEAAQAVVLPPQWLSPATAARCRTGPSQGR